MIAVDSRARPLEAARAAAARGLAIVRAAEGEHGALEAELNADRQRATGG